MRFLHRCRADGALNVGDTHCSSGLQPSIPFTTPTQDAAGKAGVALGFHKAGALPLPIQTGSMPSNECLALYRLWHSIDHGRHSRASLSKRLRRNKEAAVVVESVVWTTDGPLIWKRPRPISPAGGVIFVEPTTTNFLRSARSAIFGNDVHSRMPVSRSHTMTLLRSSRIVGCVFYTDAAPTAL